MRGEQIIRNVEQRIVISRLMRHRDVETHAVVQECVWDIPMIIAEIP